MMKKLALFLFIICSLKIQAQKLFWVGGSGNLNDRKHWSLSSGGNPCGIPPSLNTDLIFDDNSNINNDLAITITGENKVKSIRFINTNFNYHVLGSSFSSLICAGDFILNHKTFFDASTKLLFSNGGTNPGEINFFNNYIQSDVVFASGAWDFRAIKVSDANSLIFLNGTYNINNCFVTAGNLIANTGKVTFNVNHSPFKISNKLALGSNVKINSEDFILIAKIGNPDLFKVNPSVSFGLKSRLIPLKTQACTVSTSFTNATCAGACDGAFAVNFNACGAGPYELLFISTATCIPGIVNAVSPPSYVFSGLCDFPSCAGFGITVVVLLSSDFSFVTSYDGLLQNVVTPVNTTFFAKTPARCFGTCDGTQNFLITGGTPPYKVEVDPALPGQVFLGVPNSLQQTATNLCAGTHTFLVTDANGCFNTFTTSINQPAALLANGSRTNIVCNGVCNGIASVAPTGGNGGFTYVWSPAAASPTVSVNSGLCPGVVTVTVTDSKTCTATYSTIITQPPAITLTVNQSNLNCNAVCNGSASVVPTGGSGVGYTYTWTPAVSAGSVAVGLCAGVYTVDVADNLLCKKTVTLQITEPAALTAAPTQTNINCNSSCTGVINLNPSGGTPGYTYLWSPVLPAVSTASALCAGAYSYTITDVQLCKYSNSVTITQPPAITLTINNTNVTCFGACNGIAASSLSGGTAPYTYTWSPGAPTGQGTGTISLLCSSNYSLNITDALGCLNQATTSITQPANLLINASTVQPNCNGSCNGIINSVPSGGVAPYTYTLQPALGAPIIAAPPFNGLCAGFYTLTVADNVGCTQTQVINLTQPNPILLTLNSNSLTCAGLCNASISSIVNGGTPGYSFLWSNGATTSFLVGQCAGVYSATVTDVFGCSTSTTATILSPTSLSLTINPTNPNCFAQCTGIATAIVSGGTPGYTINWTNGDVGNISSNLCQGNYTATVTDLLGCSITGTVPIVTPPAITLTASNGTVSCVGSCNGTISVTPSGGSPGYNISWNSLPSQTTAIATGLCAGNYVASITDGQGCIAFTPATVVQPSVLSVNISGVVPSCNICIGAATASGVGGTAPYAYSWSPGGQITSTANNLCSGIQTVVVTDANACVVSQTVQIVQTVILVLTSNGSPISCSGACTGIANANASGGLLPYTYSWTPTIPLQTASTATGLCAGSYTVFVTDANGCSNTDAITFLSPPALSLTVNQNNVTCTSICDGSATVTAVGGTGAKSYLWLPGGQTTAIVNGLCAGNYTVTATDANFCSLTQTLAITPATSVSASFTNIDPTGCLLNNGSITHTLTGGNVPVTFTWAPGGSINPLVNLPQGIYVLNTSDAAGCTQSFTTSLSNPSSPTITVASTSISCFGQCTGSASISIAGSGPFSVNWPTVPSVSNTVSALCAGVYFVQVTDVNSCVTNLGVNISQPSQITSTGLVTNVNCNGSCTGSIDLTPNGGTPAYTYSWIPAGGSVQDPSALCAGNYTVNIGDANSCVVSNTFVVTQPLALSLVLSKTDALCNGNCNGTASVSVLGGVGPYTYSWTPVGLFPGSILNNVINLCAGVYSVTVRDFNGCSITGTVAITDPPLLTSTVSITNNVCSGSCLGSATLTASGGTLPYGFSYNTFPVTFASTVGSLCSGPYRGTVIDARGCLSINDFTITAPLSIALTSTISNPRCNASCNGSVAITVSGGTPVYNYLWVPGGATVQNPTGLCSGIYTVNVTDANLCTGFSIVTLVDPPTLIANASFTNLTCGGACNGIVTSNPIGGTGIITYSWSAPTNTNQTVSNLCAGDYTLVVIDGNQCQDTQTLTLVSPPPVMVNPAITPATCSFSDGSIIAVPTTTVSNPYTYNWLPPLASISATVSGLAAGVYTVVVTNAALCSATIAIPVSNSNGPTGSTITTTNVACNGQCNGSANISNPVGGTAPYAISWISPLSASSSISGLCAGTYVSQIRDFNNCLLFQNTNIVEPLVISDNAVITSAQCFGICNGNISLSPSGGNGGYNYVWNNAAITSSITNLCPGNYSVTITDALSCSATAVYNLPGLVSVSTITFGIDNLCYNDCNGLLMATNVAGGLPPYSYLWTDPLGQSSSSAVNICNGNYSVTITDFNGCFNIFPASITSPSQVTYTPNITQPGCGLCNGSALVNPVGGTPSYTINWSNGQSGSSATSLCGGVYLVQVTDGNNCVSNSNVVVNSSSGITGETVVFSNESCLGTCDGSVTVTAIGGSAPITYNWVHNGSSAQSQVGLCSGTYFCNMFDLNGCSRTASVVIGSNTTMTITSNVTQSSCFANTGSIVNTVSGGSGAYTYNWAPIGAVTSSVTNLAPGSYTFTLNDGFCSQSTVFIIGTINGPVISLTAADIVCSAACTGSAAISVVGGTPGYNILWSNGNNTNSISGLCAGNYSVGVSDAIGCSTSANFSISNSLPVLFSAPNITNPRCYNDCNGALTAIPSGGSLPYIYSWTPTISASPSISSLCSGIYSINIVDGNGCSAQQSYTLTNPTTMTLSALVTNASCSSVADGSAIITDGGGVLPHTYSWTPTANTTLSLTNVFPGTYSLTITDFVGCTKDTVITIIPTISVTARAGNDTSFCQNNTIILNGSSSSGATSYQWFKLPSAISFSNTVTATVLPPAGTNTYVLFALNGLCIVSDTILVTANLLPIVDAGPLISIPLYASSPIGGSPTAPPGSSFSWLPVKDLSNALISNPVTSTTVTTIYTVTVVDTNGCLNFDTVTVFVYPEIKIPSGFTPNGDGKNDTWLLDLIVLFPNSEVEVYNRWGEQLFYSKEYPVPFNGQYKGKDLPVGTYYYVIKLNHPAYTNAFTGPLTIFR